MVQPYGIHIIYLVEKYEFFLMLGEKVKSGWKRERKWVK